jgi:hypothetical protein
MEGVLPHAEENEKVKEGAKRDKVIEMGTLGLLFSAGAGTDRFVLV